jgi:hypothetical protein
MPARIKGSDGFEHKGHVYVFMFFQDTKGLGDVMKALYSCQETHEDLSVPIQELADRIVENLTIDPSVYFASL